MSNSKESTLNTQLTLSLDSSIFEESPILTSYEDNDSFGISYRFNQKSISDLRAQIEVINEDRSRLRLENEKLKSELKEIDKKNAEIELLQKIAQQALSENAKFKQQLFRFQSPPKNTPAPSSPKKITIKSPSNRSFHSKNPLQNLNFSASEQSKGSEQSSSNTSPLKSQRNLSTRIKVTRNYLKYPRATNTSKISE